MKIQLNWNLFNLSNNYLLQKKIDDCIILYDDKDYILFNIKYYQDFIYITNNNYYCDREELQNIFETEVEDVIKDYITYNDYYISPIYYTETDEGLIIGNIGIFITSNFCFKPGKELREYTQSFMTIIKYGLEPTETDIEELKTHRYPELKAEIDDILYIKQAGFYFNIFKSLYYTCNKSNNNTYINLAIKDKNDINPIDMKDLLRTIYPNWEKLQIIWRSNKYAITQYFKVKPWISMENITDNTTKKYRNIIFNQSLMSENKVINSLNLHTAITDKSNELIDKKEDNIETLIKKINKVSISKKSNNKDKKLLTNYAKYSGSKHLHYIKKEKIKDKFILDMLKELNIN
jgi:hypothetical protein